MVWEDQGLWFTLILNTVIGSVLIVVLFRCVNSRSLSTIRVYRPNHTKPPSSKGAVGTVYSGTRSSIFSLPPLNANFLEVDHDVSDESAPPCSDPIGAVYLHFLKLCALLFIVATFVCTAVIVPLAATDDYINELRLSTDPEECRKKNVSDCSEGLHCGLSEPIFPAVNMTFVLENWDLFSWFNNVSCVPIPSEGLYSLSLQNIAIESNRMYGVSIAMVLFASLVVLVVYYGISSLCEYMQRTVCLQLQNCVGWRTVLLTGLSEEQGSMADLLVFFREYAKIAPVPTSASLRREEDTPAVPANDADDRSLALFTKPELMWRIEASHFPSEAPKDFDKTLQEYTEALVAFTNAVAEEQAYRRELEEENGPSSATAVLEKRVLPAVWKKTPVVAHYGDKLEEAGAALNKALHTVPSLPFGGVAFLLLPTAIDAIYFVKWFNECRGTTSRSEARIAGPASGVMKENIFTHRFLFRFLTLLIAFVFVVLVFFWAVPVAFLGSLDSLSTIPGIGDGVKYFSENVSPTVRGILQAYLPVIVLVLFNLILPWLIRLFARKSGTMTDSDTDEAMMTMLFVFFFMTQVVLQAALQGGLFQLAAIIQDPKKETIFMLIVAIVSPQGGYWYALVISSALLSVWLDALLLGPYFVSMFLGPRAAVQKSYDDLYNRQVLPYPILIAVQLVRLSIGILFHSTVPLLVPFVALYFLCSYLSVRGVIRDNTTPARPLAEDRTNFQLAFTIWTIFSVLYVIATICGVIVCIVKEVPGAAAMAAAACLAAVVLLVYVIVVSRRVEERIESWAKEVSWGACNNEGSVSLSAVILEGADASSSPDRKLNDSILSPLKPRYGSLSDASSEAPQSPPTAAVRRSSSPVAKGKAAATPVETPQFASWQVVESEAARTTRNDFNSYLPAHQFLQPVHVVHIRQEVQNTTFSVERVWGSDGKEEARVAEPNAEESQPGQPELRGSFPSTTAKRRGEEAAPSSMSRSLSPRVERGPPPRNPEHDEILAFLLAPVPPPPPPPGKSS